jgi:hypothetical protein
MLTYLTDVSQSFGPILGPLFTDTESVSGHQRFTDFSPMLGRESSSAVHRFQFSLNALIAAYAWLAFSSDRSFWILAPAVVAAMDQDGTYFLKRRIKLRKYTRADELGALRF